MKPLFTKVALIVIFFSGTATELFAQRGMIRNQIRNDIERKQAAKQKEKGKQALEDITYEQDTRYQDFKGTARATLEFNTTDFDKKGSPKEKRTEKIIFGPKGECMVMNAGTKDEMWFMANYIDKAHYMVNVKNKTATKMPLVNMGKMAGKMAQKQASQPDEETGVWKATGETKTINGFKCAKYVYTYKQNKHHSTFEAWASPDAQVAVDQQYVFGTHIGDLAAQAAPDPNVPTGMIVLSKLYDTKDQLVHQRELIKLSKETDERYFDLSPFKVNDVLDALN